MNIPQSELRKMSDEELELLAAEIEYVREWRNHNRQSAEEYAAEAAADIAQQKAVQTIADVLYERAVVAGTDRSIKSYRRSAAKLLSIDRRLDQRFEAFVTAGVRGEDIDDIPEIIL